LVMRKADGTRLPVSMEMVRAGAPDRVSSWRCLMSDITSKKSAEDAARRFAAVVESSHDAIHTVDLDRIVSSWNPAADRLFGVTAAEAVGQSIAVIVPPELRSEHQGMLERLRSGQHIHHVETVRTAKVGKRIDVSLTLSPLKDFTGRIVGVSGIVRDISERKRSEQALLRELEFEKFLFDLSRTFIGLPEGEVDVNMERGLARVGKFLDMDRVTLLELSRESGEMAVAYSWNAPEVMGPS